METRTATINPPTSCLNIDGSVALASRVAKFRSLQIQISLDSGRPLLGQDTFVEHYDGIAGV